MADILAGALVRATDWPAAVWVDDARFTGITNITSTAYVPGTPPRNVTFTAPKTGRILLICGGQMRDEGASSRKAEMAPEVYEGTSEAGVLVLAANWEERGISGVVNWPQWHGYVRATILSGLTPGATHFARHMHRVNATSSTWDIRTRTLGVVPAP